MTYPCMECDGLRYWLYVCLDCNPEYEAALEKCFTAGYQVGRDRNFLGVCPDAFQRWLANEEPET